MTLLLRDKVLIKISDDLVFHNSALADLRQKITALKGSTPKMNVTKIDVSQFKELPASAANMPSRCSNISIANV